MRDAPDETPAGARGDEADGSVAPSSQPSPAAEPSPAASAAPLPELPPSGPRARPLAPTGAPGIGDPPVALAAIVLAADRARPREDRAAAAARAFRHLDEAEIALALRAAAADPEAVHATPSPWSSLSLALPLGLGMVMVAWSMVGLLATVALGLFIERTDDPVVRAVDARNLPIVGLLLVVAMGIGFGLLRLSALARRSGVLLGAFGSIGVVVMLVTGRPGALALAPINVAALALLLPPVGPWFEASGRAAMATLGTRGYLAAVAWGIVILIALVALPPFFEVTYDQLRVSGPGPVLAVSGFARTFGPIIAIGLIFLPAPLLRVPADREGPVVLAAGLFGLLVSGIIASALVAPIMNAMGRG